MAQAQKKELSPEAKAARAKYHKQWRDKNKDKIAQYTINYWERKAERMTKEMVEV